MKGNRERHNPRTLKETLSSRKRTCNFIAILKMTIPATCTHSAKISHIVSNPPVKS